MKREPKASATDPAISKEQPLVRAWIDDGQKMSPGGIASSMAIRGKATVVTPLRRELMPVVSVTEAMITTVRDLDVTVSVRSKECREASAPLSGSVRATYIDEGAFVSCIPQSKIKGRIFRCSIETLKR